MRLIDTDAKLLAIAREYQQDSFLSLSPDATEVQPVDVQRAIEIADAYEAMPHEPARAEVVSSYKVLAWGLIDQYVTLKARSYIFSTWLDPGQPYSSATEMIEDVRTPQHLKFFREADLPFDHPMIYEPLIPGFPLNWYFRCVHDVFGHAMRGFDFSPLGEYNAWLEHRRMFPAEAQRALFLETMAQNCWVNFGRHLRVNGRVPERNESGYISPRDRPFAEQKVGLLPDRFWR